MTPAPDLRVQIKGVLLDSIPGAVAGRWDCEFAADAVIAELRRLGVLREADDE